MAYVRMYVCITGTRVLLLMGDLGGGTTGTMLDQLCYSNTLVLQCVSSSPEIPYFCATPVHLHIM